MLELASELSILTLELRDLILELDELSVFGSKCVHHILVQRLDSVIKLSCLIQELLEVILSHHLNEL